MQKFKVGDVIQFNKYQPTIDKKLAKVIKIDSRFVYHDGHKRYPEIRFSSYWDDGMMYINSHASKYAKVIQTED